MLDPFDLKSSGKQSVKATFGIFRLSSYLGKELESFLKLVLWLIWKLLTMLAVILVYLFDRGTPYRRVNLRWLPRSWQQKRFLKSFSKYIPYDRRQAHTYILGSTDAGKSELLKLFIYNDIHYTKRRVGD